MSSPTDLAKLRVDEFAERFGSEMIPISNSFRYFSVLPLGEEEVKEYLEDPIAAVPPTLQARLPRISILLVPYIEKANGKNAEHVTFERPSANRQALAVHKLTKDAAFLTLGIKDQETAEYHYTFYNTLASVACENPDPELFDRFSSLLREEINARVHGEVDEKSWQLKQALLRKQSSVRRETKQFRAYAIQSLIDTLTLYLHGICCDIDVETGPRQLPSRHLKRRLLLLQESYAPPSGYAVFPEDLNKD